MPGEQDPKTPEDRENELSDEREGRGTPEREDSAGEYAPEQPDDVLAEQDGEESVERLLTTLVQVSRLTMALLEAGDPNPEELETLAARRAEVFARLQRAVERERQQRKSPVTPEEKARRAAIAGELQQVDGQCVQLGRERLAESKSDWEKARLLRRTLVAYGWNDPEYAPRGYFVDTVD